MAAMRRDDAEKPDESGKTGESGDPIASLESRLRGHVEMLAGVIGPRHLGKPSSIEATLSYLRRELSAIGDARGASVQSETYLVAAPDGSDVEATNLVMEWPGAKRPERTVILGAHYDTEAQTPGADDNASAVAVLIETARLLADVSSERTMRFVAFACEEMRHFASGSMGSQHHARACRNRGERVDGMLCLEMVGFYADAPGSQSVPHEIPRALHWLFPRRGDFIASVGNLRSWRLLWRFRRGFKRAVRFPLFSIGLPELIQPIRRSDNSSFWDQGYPALMITDTSYLRNANYHQPSDTPETLDYRRMAAVTVGVAGAMATIARAPTPAPPAAPTAGKGR